MKKPKAQWLRCVAALSSIRFDAHLPPIYSLLHAQDGEVAIEVLAQLDAYRIRGIALTPYWMISTGHLCLRQSDIDEELFDVTLALKR